MEITVRIARKEDAQPMLQVYNKFITRFVGSASRTLKPFRRMLRKKENINWVALDSQNRIIGYVHGRIDKRINRGEFAEIVVDPEQDYEQVAKPLVEKVNVAFMDKKVSSIIAGSNRNPAYEKLFPPLGFFESESTGVFMYAILNVHKFLNELSSVFANRLKLVKDWSGLVQIECEGHSLFLQKTKEGAQQIAWTNQPINLKITLARELLTKLIFGIVNPVESHRTGQLPIDTLESEEKAIQILKALFPKKQFLIMDYW